MLSSSASDPSGPGRQPQFATDRGNALSVVCREPRHGAAGTAVAPSARTLKALSEPAAQSHGMRVTVAHLRYVATRIGGGWRYDPPADALFIDEEEEEEGLSESTEEELSDLRFVILTHDFVNEEVTIRAFIPITWPEACGLLDNGRCQNRAAHFPTLVPASTQTCPGIGIVLACPAWCSPPESAYFPICLDTSAIDGRIFSVISPAYVDRIRLLHLADLLDWQGIDVRWGENAELIEDNVLIHIGLGEFFLFLMQETQASAMLTLPQALASRAAWFGASGPVPSPATGHYCLVHGNELVHFTTRFEAPMQYRSDIAACTGIALHRLRIFPASPAILDAALEGFPCRAVVAICESTPAPAPPSFGVLVDARSLFAGWRSIIAVAGRVSCLSILIRMQEEAPAGTSLSIEDVAEGVDFVEVHPGQVLVLRATRTLRDGVESGGVPEAVPQEPLTATGSGGEDQATAAHQPPPAEGPHTTPSAPADNPPSEGTGAIGPVQDARASHATDQSESFGHFWSFRKIIGQSLSSFGLSCRPGSEMHLQPLRNVEVLTVTGKAHF